MKKQCDGRREKGDCGHPRGGPGPSPRDTERLLGALQGNKQAIVFGERPEPILGSPQRITMQRKKSLL